LVNNLKIFENDQGERQIGIIFALKLLLRIMSNKMCSSYKFKKVYDIK